MVEDVRSLTLFPKFARVNTVEPITIEDPKCVLANTGGNQEVLLGAVARLIERNNFPCVMAKSLLNTDALVERKILYPGDEIEEEFRSIVRDFEVSFGRGRGINYSLAISFESSPTEDTGSFETFEAFFWELLGLIRDKTEASGLSTSPEDEHFRFSIEGRGYFVILLHPASPRVARRAETPAIILNRHEQFEKLKERGVYKAVRDRIRSLDKSLNGSINPTLTDFGEASEIYQYSGRDYSGGGGKCPFNKVKGWLGWK